MALLFQAGRGSGLSFHVSRGVVCRGAAFAADMEEDCLPIRTAIGCRRQRVRMDEGSGSSMVTRWMMQTQVDYQFLESRPRSNYRQLWVKSRHIRAEVLYRLTIGPEP